MSNMRGALRERKSTKGTFWILDLEVAIMFGTTELTASIVWKDAQVRIFYSSTLLAIPASVLLLTDHLLGQRAPESRRRYSEEVYIVDVVAMERRGPRG